MTIFENRIHRSISTSRSRNNPQIFERISTSQLSQLEKSMNDRLYWLGLPRWVFWRTSKLWSLSHMLRDLSICNIWFSVHTSNLHWKQATKTLHFWAGFYSAQQNQWDMEITANPTRGQQDMPREPLNSLIVERLVQIDPLVVFYMSLLTLSIMANFSSKVNETDVASSSRVDTFLSMSAPALA